MPEELFPREETLTYLDELGSRDPLSPPDQLALALRVADDAWTALLICHLATRQLARGRDTRALGPDAPLGIADRCRIGRSVRPFPDELSEGGDPLGDTYHYWANVIAGVTSASAGGLTGALVERLFLAGPFLMRAVRAGVFGRRLFYGTHRRIDHLGLCHGLTLGVGA